MYRSGLFLNQFFAGANHVRHAGSAPLSLFSRLKQQNETAQTGQGEERQKLQVISEQTCERICKVGSAEIIS
jgi:hypothetical protein